MLIPADEVDVIVTQEEYHQLREIADRAIRDFATGTMDFGRLRAEYGKVLGDRLPPEFVTGRLVVEPPLPIDPRAPSDAH
jgi:hypothetical protein